MIHTLKRLKYFVWAFFFGFFLPQEGKAQQIAFHPIHEAVKHPHKWVFFGDSRNSFFQNAPLRIRGLKVGVEYDKTWRMGMGVHWAVWDRTNGKRSRMYGVSPFLAYQFTWRKFQYSLPIQLNYSQLVRGNTKNHLLSYEAALIIERTFFRYFSVGLGMGYRLLLISDLNAKEGITAPVYILKFGLDLKQIRDDIHGRF